MNDLKSIYNHINDHFPESLEELRRFIQLKGVSATGEGINDCVDFQVNFLKDLDAEVEKVNYKGGHPYVYAKIKSSNPDAKTIVFYSEYDEQPAPPLEEWTLLKKPPERTIERIFSAEIVNIPTLGDCIVARGAAGKCGLMAPWVAIRSILAVKGDLPVNVILLSDGEEEIGSPHIHQFAKDHADELKEADALIFWSETKNRAGIPQVTLGLKGISYIELEAKGGDWGGPCIGDNHGQHAAWVDSPVWRLLWALNTMKNKEDDIIVDGFYDDVEPPSPEDVEIIKKYMLPNFNEESWKESLGIKKFRKNLHGADAIVEYLLKPTLNIDGIFGGYTGPRSKTILPYRAIAKMDIRLVPKMDPQRIIKKVKKHLERVGYGDINVKTWHAYPYVKTSVTSPLARTAIRSLEKSGFKEMTIWPTAAGSAPLYNFCQPPINLPFLLLGVGHAFGTHGPNEYTKIDGWQQSQKVAATFLYEFSKN